MRIKAIPPTTHDQPLIHFEGCLGFLYDGEKLYVRLITKGVSLAARGSQKKAA